MSDTEKDKEFYEMADAFIDLANKQKKKIDQGKVSATFLYAAARFNTFIAAAGAGSAINFSSSKESAFDYFMAEYKKMLEEHFADYQANFNEYIETNNNTLN